jgi:hypothetical protein
MNPTSSLPTSSSKSSLGQILPKKLRFDYVVIRDMPIELGEHPASDGAPITIGWEPESTRKVHIDLYELSRDDPKTVHELRLSVTERAKMLLDAGYDIEDIVNASEQAQAILKQRNDSSRNQKWEVLQEAREKASRTIKKLTRSNPAA